MVDTGKSTGTDAPAGAARKGVDVFIEIQKTALDLAADSLEQCLEAQRDVLDAVLRRNTAVAGAAADAGVRLGLAAADGVRLGVNTLVETQKKILDLAAMAAKVAGTRG
jgi:hypothetical protein